jgi:hypothetical protein
VPIVFVLATYTLLALLGFPGLEVAHLIDSMIRTILFIIALFPTFADDHVKTKKEGRARMPAPVALVDSPIFKGKKAITFDIKKNGKTPEKVVLYENWTQRRIASVAKHFIGDTTKGKGITVKFETIELVVDPDDKDKFFLIIKTMGQEQELLPSIDRARLESGETLTFKERKTSETIVGDVTADITVKIRFDPKAKKLTLPYVSGGVKISSLIAEESDSAEVKNLDCIPQN